MDRTQFQEAMRVYLPVGSAVLSACLSLTALVVSRSESVVWVIVAPFLGTAAFIGLIILYIKRRTYRSNSHNVYVKRSKDICTIKDVGGHTATYRKELTLGAKTPTDIYSMPRPGSTGKIVDFRVSRGLQSQATRKVPQTVFGGKPILLISFDSPLKDNDCVVVEYDIEDGFLADHDAVGMNTDVGQEACEMIVRFTAKGKPTEATWTVSYDGTVLDGGSAAVSTSEFQAELRYDFSSYIAGKAVKLHCGLGWQWPRGVHHVSS